MICVSFVSVICVMVNKLILMNSIEWTPCVSAVSCKYLLQYEGKLIFANPLIHDWLWISRTSLCEAVCLRSEVRYRADATAIVVLSWAMLAEGIGSIFIRDNMEPDRLALWMQVCHFGYYSYIYPLRRQKPHAEYWNVPQLIRQCNGRQTWQPCRPCHRSLRWFLSATGRPRGLKSHKPWNSMNFNPWGWCFTPLQIYIYIYMYNRYIYIYCIYIILYHIISYYIILC